MAITSIEKKKAELSAAKAEAVNGPSDAKKNLIRVRTWFLLIGIALVIAEVVIGAAAESPQGTILGLVGALLLCGWVVILFAGLFVK